MNTSERQSSETAKDFIDNQLRLEADAREALPYSFDRCTQPLGALRQPIFSCLTCNPTTEDGTSTSTNAGICYSCSIACHGEHELVELFNRRNFVCDCGTTRLPCDSPCTLRIDPATGLKGPIHSQAPSDTNSYNQNFRNRFCGCREIYDAHREKGTMFQCLGLASEADGGCGEDWWHPECIMGLPRQQKAEIRVDTNKEVGEAGKDQETNDTEEPMPCGFPHEDDFEHFLCFKCLNACPWIKRYAGTPGFLPPLPMTKTPALPPMSSEQLKSAHYENAGPKSPGTQSLTGSTSSTLAENGERKRKSPGSDLENSRDLNDTPKRIKIVSKSDCYYDTLPEVGCESFSLFLVEDFRDHLCRCPRCYARLKQLPQILEEEDSYEPPLSASGNEENGSAATGSLLDRGEAALSNMDRVRAIEGVMAYNHLKDKVKAFLQPFAESGQAVGAEDIKTYFEKLRGDEQGTEAATLEAGTEDRTDNRKEQDGF